MFLNYFKNTSDATSCLQKLSPFVKWLQNPAGASIYHQIINPIFVWDTLSCKNRNRNLRHVHPVMVQISLHIWAVWSESSLGAFWIAHDVKFPHVDNKDSDQTAWLGRLIWVFIGRTCQKVHFLKLQLISWMSNIIFWGIKINKKQIIYNLLLPPPYCLIHKVPDHIIAGLVPVKYVLLQK